MGVFSNENVFAPEAVQRILDAAALLQVQRSQLAGALAGGEDPPGATIVGRGLDEINEWLRDQLPRWDEFFSVRLSTTVDALRLSLPTNRSYVGAGGSMVSLFDYYRTEPMARLILSAEDQGDYRFCYAPLQMKIVERRCVLLEGPPHEGRATLMTVTDHGCLSAALAYWRALNDAAFPCAEVGSRLDDITPRQRQVIGLLAGDLSDEQIARTLGVSVRTVRYDIADLLGQLDARSRFAAGLRLGEIGVVLGS